MQYKFNTKIIIDKRKLDLLIRLGCPDEQLLQIIKTGKFNKTEDKLIDEILESLYDIREFKNWGGNHNPTGINGCNKNKKLGQVDHQVECQVDCQVVDKDIDKDIGGVKKEYIKRNIKENANQITTEQGWLKNLNEEINNIINNINPEIKDAMIHWIEYKKEKGDKYKPIGLKDCIKKLEKLSGNNKDLAMKIVEQSTSNGWSGLFPLKEKQEVGIKPYW